MNNKFTICKANAKQHNTILNLFPKISEEDSNNSIAYVAISDTNAVIGRILIIEREVPSPICGRYWYIINLYVDPDYRRMKIATKLVETVKKQAENDNIVYLYGSAESTPQATFFWFSQGFTLNAYGRKGEDPTKPLEYGNFNHLFSYCVKRKIISAGDSSYKVRKISRDEIINIINKLFTDERKKEYHLSKIDTQFGFVIDDDNGKIKGAIFAFPDSMQPPMDSTRWWITLFVEPEHRNKGIGKTLVHHMYQYAQDKDVVQLSNIGSDNDSVFWLNVGFDIFFWSPNSKTGARQVTSMLRIK